MKRHADCFTLVFEDEHVVDKVERAQFSKTIRPYPARACKSVRRVHQQASNCDEDCRAPLRKRLVRVLHCRVLSLPQTVWATCFSNSESDSQRRRCRNHLRALRWESRRALSDTGDKSPLEVKTYAPAAGWPSLPTRPTTDSNATQTTRSSSATGSGSGAGRGDVPASVAHDSTSA